MPSRGFRCILAMLALVLWPGGPTELLAAENSPRPQPPVVREIFVPFEDLSVLLQQQPRRVLLSRQQYADLLQRAKKAPETHAPQAALLVAADYTATIHQQRAQISGALEVEVLEDGLHAVALDLGGVGLLDAQLDGHSAAIGQPDGGRPVLLVEGLGRHRLALKMAAPLETTAARQVLNFRLPRPPAARMHLTAAGDVEVKSGADVVSRVVDETAGVTRFELLPRPGDMSLVLTLNSHLQRRQQAIVARSVLIDEITQAYEKLHATISLAVLQRAVDRFRFAVPEKFEILEVTSPLLARWNLEDEGGRRVLNVQLREQTTETVVLSIAAIDSSYRPGQWRLQRLTPLDVVGEVAVVGLLAEDRLEAKAIIAEGLIPIDTAVLRNALPATISRAAPAPPPLRAVAAYYAPQGRFELSARFDKPPAEMAVTTNLLLILEDQSQQVRGGFAILPKVEKQFAFDFTAPPGWHVTGVTAADEKPLGFERYEAAGKDLPQGTGRIHVRLPQGIPVGQEYRVYFQASRAPADWLAEWDSRSVEFPAFAALGAARDEGAIAVEARDDMTVRPAGQPQQLTPLDEKEKAKYGLSGVAASLAYRYARAAYRLSLAVERTQPRLTARTFSFALIKPDALTAHYELIYNVAEARTRKLSFLLPQSTPSALRIKGLGDVRVKEYVSQPSGENRRWDVTLEDARRGTLRIAADFDQPLPMKESLPSPASGEGSGVRADGRKEGKAQSQPPILKQFAVPVVQADGVLYQSGLVSVEGSAELDIDIPQSTARRVDVGELVDAEYQPGRRLLGVFEFVGRPPRLAIDVFRRPEYPLYPALVERAELSTYVAPDGTSQNQANLRLRTKALFLELRLPGEGKSELWSALLDGTPIKPQREAESVLISLPAAAAAAPHDLQIVYATPLGRLSFGGKLKMPAPKLLLRADRDTAAEEVPLSDLYWHLHLPSGYEVMRADGTVATDQLQKPLPGAVYVAGALYYLAGGIEPFFWAPTLAVRRVAKTAALYEYAERQMMPSEEAAPEAALPPADEKKRADMIARLGATYDLAGAPSAPGEKSAEALRRAGEAAAKKEQGEKPAAESRARAGGVEAAGAKAASPMPPEQRKVQLGGLEGVRSLRIDLNQSQGFAGETVTFRSLGVEPQLVVTLAGWPRLEVFGWDLDALGFGLFLALLLVGLAMTNRPVSQKVRLIILVGLLATLIPLAFDDLEVARACNMLFYAASLLVPYYLLAGLAKWLCGAICRCCCAARPGGAVTTAATTILLAVCLLPAAAAQPGLPGLPESKSGTYLLRAVEPPEPVNVPEDAVIVPYDPAAKQGVEEADRLLVPYDKYVELWNRAYPDKKLETRPAPVPYALAGAAYRTTLEGEEYLLVSGRLEIDVLSDQYVSIPLGLGGGVLSRAELDGKPARLSIAEPAGGVNPPNAPLAAPQAAAVSRSLLLLLASGKGRHELQVDVRMRLARQAGWRIAEGFLPAAPAASLTITVPQPQTELRLRHQPADRYSLETQQAGEQITTALGADGAISIQWRPKLAAAELDRSLTARSTALLDVQEDGLRLTWRLALEFPRSQREQFTLSVPQEYRVEKLDGGNIRGWEARTAEGKQTLEITLLKPAKDQEEFTLHLWRNMPVGPPGETTELAVPPVVVRDAALSSGELTIRRSPLLELRTLETSNVTRIDLRQEPASPSGGSGSEQSPLGIRPYEAYRFVTTDFTLRLAARQVRPRVTATVQTVLKIAEYQRGLESRVMLDVQDRPIYRAAIFLPEQFKLEYVLAPGEFQWSLTEEDRLLTIYLAAGQQGEVPIVIRGTFGPQGRLAPFPATIPLPRLEVGQVDRQQGEIAVQADPAFTVEAAGLNEHCEQVAPSRLFGWLRPEQQAATRLALHYRQPDYTGTLRLGLATPSVTCETISNVRVTDRAVEETILLDFTIQNAGIRRLSFLLPASMKGYRLNARMLRNKPVDEEADGMIRVPLEFQEEVMGQLRVLVENDRLLKRGETYSAPIPVVDEKDWRTDRQYVSLQSAGRDEVEISTPVGLEALWPQQKQWDLLKGKLGGGSITHAYLVAGDAKSARLEFKTKGREAVKTAGARIGLAQATLVLDNQGAYRAEQIYHLDNTTEPFLEIRLPAGAQLWTARVAGEPVKPAKAAQSNDDRLVRIPLVKTAPGDLDYMVVLRYGGKLRAPGSLGSVGFPLVHTVNIRPELSQVRLYLPKTHSWSNFGGTMRLVTEEADLAAGVVEYQTKQTQRLVETIRHGDEFAKVRAAANVKNIEAQIEAFQSSLNVAPTQDFVAAGGVQGSVVRQAKEESKKAQQAVQKQVQADDNRDRLNAYFGQQGVSRAKNTVQELGGNFLDVTSIRPPAAPPTAPPQSGQLQFDNKWLDKNALVLARPPAEAGKPDVSNAPSANFRFSFDQSASQSLANAANQPAAPEVAQGKAKQQLEETQPRAIIVLGTSVVQGRDQVARYQERLERQQAAQQVNGLSTTYRTFTVQPPAQPGQESLRIAGGALQDVFNIGARPAGATYDLSGGSETVGSISAARSLKLPPRQELTELSSGFLKSGAGRLTLGGTNTYGGSITMPGGPVTPGSLGQQGFISQGSISQGRALGVDSRAADATVIFQGKIQLTDGAGGPAPSVTIAGAAGQAPAAPAPPGPAVAGPAQPRPPVTGLASLELQMPTCDDIYEVYRFTTPRGEVELSGWAASRALASRLARLAATAVVLLLVLAAVQAVRRGRLDWLGSGPGSTLLIALGLLAVVLGFFPIAGLAAFLAGIVIKIRRALARRAAAPQPTPVQAEA
jgi:autotransporter-associated beta strand protein